MIEEFKAALQEVARSTGRRGDTFLAHITPEEAEYLEKKYGGGTENPVTGLMEYAGEPGAGRGGEGSTGGGQGPGGGGDSGGGGFGGSRGDERGGMSEADAPSNVGRGFGGAQPQGRASRGEVRSGTSAPGKGKGPARGGTGKGSPSSASPEAGRAISRALSAMMSLGFGVPTSPVSLVDPEKDLVGIPAAVRDIAQALGNLKDVALGKTSAQFGKVESADPQGPTGVDVAAPSGVPAGGGEFFVVPYGTGPLDFSLTRPDAMEAPHFLGMGQAMTPLQQRSMLATYGTGGESGAYRSEPAQEYFRNLFLRNVLGDQGEIVSGARVLPVEAQYAREGLGLDVTPETSVENFARALSGLPSSEQVAEYMAAWQAAQPVTAREA